MPRPGSIFSAIGRALLFAVACGVLCLIVAELVLGYNMYFQPESVVCWSCYAPAMLAGLLHLGFTIRRQAVSQARVGHPDFPRRPE